MLVLLRKYNESVIVGGSESSEPMLKVTVLEISRRNVKLGFEAGKDLPVHRWEVWERIRANNRPNRSTGGLAAAAR